MAEYHKGAKRKGTRTTPAASPAFQWHWGPGNFSQTEIFLDDVPFIVQVICYT